VAERAALLPVEAGVADLPALRVSPGDAGRLARGQAVLLRGRDAPVIGGWGSVSSHGSLVALAEGEKGELRPRRIFNLPRGWRRRMSQDKAPEPLWRLRLRRAQFPLASAGILRYCPACAGVARAHYLWRPRWTTSRPGRRP